MVRMNRLLLCLLTLCLLHTMPMSSNPSAVKLGRQLVGVQSPLTAAWRLISAGTLTPRALEAIATLRGQYPHLTALPGYLKRQDLYAVEVVIANMRPNDRSFFLRAALPIDDRTYSSNVLRSLLVREKRVALVRAMDLVREYSNDRTEHGWTSGTGKHHHDFGHEMHKVHSAIEALERLIEHIVHEHPSLVDTLEANSAAIAEILMASGPEAGTTIPPILPSAEAVNQRLGQHRNSVTADYLRSLDDILTRIGLSMLLRGHWLQRPNHSHLTSVSPDSLCLRYLSLERVLDEAPVVGNIIGGRCPPGTALGPGITAETIAVYEKAWLPTCISIRNVTRLCALAN